MFQFNKQTGVIDQEWANFVSEWGTEDIYKYNPDNADQILEGIDILELGNLAVTLPESHVFTPDDRHHYGRFKSVIDLAFEDNAFCTLTTHLLEASRRQLGEGALLTKQLEKRMITYIIHNSDETGNDAWFIPTSYIELVQASRLSAA